MPAVALFTLLTFGCTTVRAPVSGIAPTVAIHGATAEPQVELWLESAGDVTPAESARAVAEAREALRRALQDRQLGADDVLVVRAQAVSRTRSHRNEQKAAIAGIVVGAVVLVALVVVAASRGNAPSLPHHAVRGAGGFRPGAAPMRPGIRPRVAPPVFAASRPTPVHVDVDVEIVAPTSPDAPPRFEAVADQVVEPDEYAVPPQPVAPTERISALTLPAPSPLSVGDRSFFDGDWLRLELLVVDARSGAVRWAKAVADDVDVRDARKVRRAVDAALAEQDGWYAPAQEGLRGDGEAPGS